MIFWQCSIPNSNGHARTRGLWLPNFSWKSRQGLLAEVQSSGDNYVNFSHSSYSSLSAGVEMVSGLYVTLPLFFLLFIKQVFSKGTQRVNLRTKMLLNSKPRLRKNTCDWKLRSEAVPAHCVGRVLSCLANREEGSHPSALEKVSVE